MSERYYSWKGKTIDLKKVVSIGKTNDNRVVIKQKHLFFFEKTFEHRFHSANLCEKAYHKIRTQWWQCKNLQS